MNFVKKLFVTLLFTLITCVNLYAQGPPGLPAECEDADDCPVPLDNWLIVLFALGLIITTWHLHNKQKKEAIA